MNTAVKSHFRLVVVYCFHLLLLFSFISTILLQGDTLFLERSKYKAENSVTKMGGVLKPDLKPAAGLFQNSVTPHQ